MTFEMAMLSLAFTVVVNLCGSVWWAGNMNARMKKVEDDMRGLSALPEIAARVKNLEEKIGQVALMPERMARIETVVQTLVQTTQNTGASVAVIKDFLITAETTRLKQAVDNGTGTGTLTPL